MSALMRILGEHWVLTLALTAPGREGAGSGRARIAEPAPGREGAGSGRARSPEPAPGATPYATPLFFALAEPDTIGRHAAPLLVFASDPDSHHGQLAGRGPTAAAAAVYLETNTVGQVRGAQLRGSLIREDRWTPAGAAGLRELYVARHPIAAPMLAAGRHRLYALVLSWAKLTDNRLGFGVHPIARFDVTCAEVEQSRP